MFRFKCLLGLVIPTNKIHTFHMSELCVDFAAIDRIQATFAKDLGCIDNENFRGHCLKCDQPIVANQLTSFVENLIKFNLHTDCFRCGMCDVKLDNFISYESQHICADCYRKKVIGNCDACTEAFQENSTVVKAGAKQYHRECFVCTVN